MKVKLFKVNTQDENCPYCNWKVSNIYVLAQTQEQANAIYEAGEGGLCGNCIADQIVELGYPIENFVKSQPRLCRYCGNMVEYGTEGSMMCKPQLAKSFKTAKTCPKWFPFTMKKQYVKEIRQKQN